MLENLYNLRIINANEVDQVLLPSVSGFETIQLNGVDAAGIVVPAGSTITVPVQVATYPDYAGKGSHPIEFTFRYRSVDEADTEARMITEKASFIGE